MLFRSEQYYLNQARQKGGRLPAFHGARFQRGYGLGAIFIGLFHWAMPHLKKGAKVLGKKALQTSLNVAQDVLGEEHLKWRQQRVLNKPWASLPRILHKSSRVVPEKLLKGKHNPVQPSVQLWPRN